MRQFAGSPAILLFQPSRWDPAEREYIDAYNRLIAGLAGDAGARLIRVGGYGDWRSLTFEDDAVSLPVVDGDASLAAEFGMAPGECGVIVVDAKGEVRWRHTGGGTVDTVQLARALSNSVETASKHGAWSRREFVATALGAAVTLVVAPKLARAEGMVRSHAAGPGDPRAVSLNVNGRDVALQLEPRVSLLDALREYAGLTGTKKGCDHGQCGACTVHIDGRRELSCLTFAVMQQGKKITTIEGLARGSDLHPMQQAFITHDGFQCGYCTSGQIMSATAMVNEPWGAGDDDVREAMSGNICRCGAYPGIVAAIQDIRSGRRATQ